MKSTLDIFRDLIMELPANPIVDELQDVHDQLTKEIDLYKRMLDLAVRQRDRRTDQLTNLKNSARRYMRLINCPCEFVDGNCSAFQAKNELSMFVDGEKVKVHKRD